MSKTAKIIIGVIVVSIIAYVAYKWYTKSNATASAGSSTAALGVSTTDKVAA